jgi:hypothetical protein
MAHLQLVTVGFALMIKIDSAEQHIAQLQQIQRDIIATIQSLETGKASGHLTLKTLIGCQGSLQALVNEPVQNYVQSELFARPDKRLTQAEKNAAAELLALLKVYIDR